MDKTRFKIRLFLWILLIVVFFGLFWLKIVPSGEITYVLRPDKRSDQIGEFKPDDRLGEDSRDFFTILGNPVYFTLRPPRHFERVEMTIKYRNPDNLGLVEAGILADGKLWQYKMEPIENRAIDQISGVWHTIKEDGVMFLQKEKKYENIEEFLDNLPNINEIGVYNYDLDYDYKDSDYEALDQNMEITGLRGAWQFYTYIKNEDLDLDVHFRDLNQNDDSDMASLFVYYEDQVIDSQVIEDKTEGKEGTGEEEGLGNIDFKLAGLPEGAYKIELRAGSDIVSNIKSGQSKLSFVGSLEFMNTGQDLKLFTDSEKIQITTIDPGSLQEVEIIELYSPKSSFADVVDVNETHRQFESVKLNGINQINLEKDGVIISGNGVLAFSEEALINPRIKKVDGKLLVDEEEINHIITRYDLPDEYGSWNIATIDFDLSQAYMENGKYGIMISAPGLRADDDVDDRLEVGEIRVKLKGKSLFGKIIEVIRDK